MTNSHASSHILRRCRRRRKNHDLCGTATIECDVVLSKWGRESEIFFSKQQSARHYVCNKRNNLQMQSEHL